MEGGAAAGTHDASKRPHSLSDGATSAPSPVPASAASPAAAAPLRSPFAQQLRAAGLSLNDDELNRLAALGGGKGVFDMDDLHALNEAEVRASVDHMLLTPMQLNKLLKRLGELGATTPSHWPPPLQPFLHDTHSTPCSHLPSAARATGRAAASAPLFSHQQQVHINRARPPLFSTSNPMYSPRLSSGACMC